MALYELQNGKISIQADSLGAELKSLKRTDTGTEYMWEGNPEYWKRTSPVLFPLVGSLHHGSYLLDGTRYPMGQHGFARDMEFELKSQSEREIWFCLKSSQETLEKYPYEFLLEIGYKLQEYSVLVQWKVSNPAEKEMHFSIGGHPAFFCPPVIKEESDPGFDCCKQRTKCEILFEGVSVLNTRMLENGLAAANLEQLKLEKKIVDGKQYGGIFVTEDLFDRDAYIIEEHQTREVALAGPDGKFFLAVKFDAPLFGLWAPKKNAPFVCIEPWYGRCDGVDADQIFENKAYINRLEPGQVFNKNYHICIY